MNSGFYKDLDTNFEQALEMSEREFSHTELLEMLRNGNIPEKQIAALKLDSIDSIEESQILLDNLTGCDGKIREAVALRINRFLNENPKSAIYFTQAEIFANASIDINANICRLVVDSVAILKESTEFSKIYTSKILEFIYESFEELDKFIFRDKKYVINKQLFKLYWSLEALKLFAIEIPFNKLFPILERASREREYTIREKVAQIIVLVDTDSYEPLKKRLKDDENYYVREVFNKN